MKPLQKIETIKRILTELTNRSYTWSDIYIYLRCYNVDATHPEYTNFANVDEYFMSYASELDDKIIEAMINEFNGTIIQNDIQNQTLVNSDCWRNGYFRVFISHLTSNKQSASRLKDNLSKYGIDCFVAHEDIEPSKLWQTEIEKALSSMDLLCAIITEDFYQSKWCDQEIGIAIGRCIPTLSIKKGADPHGFISKYQAIKAKEKAFEVAQEVFETICKMEKINKKYFSLLMTLFLNSKNEPEALDWLNLINSISNFNVNNVDKLTSLYNQNPILKSEAIIKEYNKLAEKIGSSEIKYSSFTDNYNDLPF